MLKYLFVILSVCLFACSPKEFTVEGTFESRELDGKPVFIKERINREWAVIDSAMVQNGRFVFSGVADSARIVYLTFTDPAGKNLRRAFIIENGKLSLHVDSAFFMTVKGTSQNELLQQYQDKKQVFVLKAKELADVAKDSTRQSDATSQLEQLEADETAYDREFAAQHINTMAGTFAFINSFYGWTLEEKESLIAKMSPETRRIERIQEIIADVETEKKVAVGMMFTDFKLPSLQGDSLALSGLVGKTDYVLVDFWASWCGPCIRSLPELVTLYNRHKGSRLEILGVSLDTDEQAWKGMIASRGLGWKHISDLKGWKNSGSRIYAVNSIPFTVLIDKNGRIAGKNLSVLEIEKLLLGKADEK